MTLPRVAIEGRAVADPELRFAPSGMAVGRLRLVASDRKKNEATGEWEDSKTLWVDVTMFKSLAENVAESIEKGDLVTVVGKLATDEWNDRDSGEKRSKTVVIADSVAASLTFRTIRHGDGKAARASGAPSGSPSGRPEQDPWATKASDPNDMDPPF